MNVRVVILHAAEADLLELRRHLLGRFGAAAWKGSYAKIKQAVTRIAAHPHAGKLPEELAELNLMQYRQVLAGMNRVIYELRDETAYVHVICDARRDLRTLLMRRLVETDIAVRPGNPAE
ncbi:MAG: type II toxin-antitoxin system RelE/ParE family toxin [Pseudoxanthomonas sp.]